jgi:hypothetical protein
MYKFRQYPFKRVTMNHNTFINCSGNIYLDWGYQTNVSNTNNIYVNCNLQGYPGISTIDVGEQDLDGQPMGLVNIHTFPAADTSYDQYRALPRKYLFEGNVVYWDPRLSTIVSTLNSNHVNGVTNWQDQMIIMNARTTSMFNDNTTYPYLTMGTNYTEAPVFTDPKTLMTTQVDVLKAFTLGTCDTNSTDVMADWRVTNIGNDFYVYSDWPIPVNLAYSNAKLLTGATGGFPVGDLNWFPVKKGEWTAQRTAEYAAITQALNTGGRTITAVPTDPNAPVVFSLDQNYPNPFNPSTKISFSIAKSAVTTLKVFNALGQEVATLVNGIMPAGTHDVSFNASGLASGMYFYRLTSGDATQMKKMVILK